MWRYVLLSFGLLALLGCGSKKTTTGVVTGSITYKGQPVNGPVLVLYRNTGAGENYNIPVTQEGTFNVSNVPEGEYIVVIQPSKEMSQTTKGLDPAKLAENKAKIEEMKTVATIPIPKKYKERTATDLKMTITKEDQTINFELKD
ncbi:MAG TPA: hypothetical protein VG122_05335 [Gemmata sp.]|jgi:hypothetical protein|nr:hypothetical protein [Gemmata sp.]